MNQPPNTPDDSTSDDSTQQQRPVDPAQHSVDPPQPDLPLPAILSPAPPTRGRRALAGAALAVGLAVGGAGVAAAVTGNQPTPSGGATSQSDKAPDKGPGHRGMDGPMGRMGGPGGPDGVGIGRALHGELVVPQADGTGTRTVVVQTGAVSSVSATSLVVKSTDGFTSTYVLDKSTRALGPDGKISSVKTGHTVSVVAAKSGSTLTALDVGDRTLMEQRWGKAGAPRDGERPGGPAAPPSTAPVTPGASSSPNA